MDYSSKLSRNLLIWSRSGLWTRQHLKLSWPSLKEGTVQAVRFQSNWFVATFRIVVFVIALNTGSLAASTDRPEETQATPAAQTAALIIEANGSWVVDHNGRTIAVEAGDAIPEGGILHYKSKNATISGRFVNGEPLKYPGQDIVGKPLTAQQKPESKPWWAAALDFPDGATDPGITPAVRNSRSSVVASDAVTKLSNESVDLTPVFADKKIPFEKEPFVTLKKVAFGKAVDAPKWGPVKVSFTKRNQARVTVKGIEEGLYELIICDRTAAHRPTPDSSWIIVSNDSDFASLSKQFQSAKVSARKWNQIPKAKVNRMLRSYLTALSGSTFNSGSGSGSQH